MYLRESAYLNICMILKRKPLLVSICMLLGLSTSLRILADVELQLTPNDEWRIVSDGFESKVSSQKFRFTGYSSGELQFEGVRAAGTEWVKFSLGLTGSSLTAPVDFYKKQSVRVFSGIDVEIFHVEENSRLPHAEIWQFKYGNEYFIRVWGRSTKEIESLVDALTEREEVQSPFTKQNDVVHLKEE